MSLPSPVAPLLRAFFVDHLLQHKAVSPQTISAYRDAWRRLLAYLQQTHHLTPDAVTVDDLSVPTVLAFLDHLEQDRGNTVRSRNARLAALRSFARFVALRAPEAVDAMTRLLAIPVKRTTRPLVGFLARDEMDAVLAACDPHTRTGRRDYALVLTLYNTGARVSELIGVHRADVHFGTTTVIHLHGKGRKERAVPLWPRTARTLRTWFAELGATVPDYAFPNAQRQRLTRQGVAYLLHDAAQRAGARCPSLTTKRISPHVIRHTTAMHLLQAGVDEATIALWLGHERLETTHRYLEADLAMKERALRTLSPLGRASRPFKPDDHVLAFLASL
jgi:site-specific recombinase XerD